MAFKIVAYTPGLRKRPGVFFVFDREHGYGKEEEHHEFMGISQHYEPDFLVRLSSGVTLVLEIKGWEDEQDRAKHQAAQRWVKAVNNWGKLGRWAFHTNRDPQILGRELEWLARDLS